MNETEYQPNQPKITEPAIIQVAPDEELGSLLQRLRQEAATEIRLVIPNRSIIAQGSIVLKLLADVAGKLKKEVLVVSDSPQIQSLSKRAGLHVEGVEAGDVDGHGFVQGTDMALEQPEMVATAAAAAATQSSDRGNEPMVATMAEDNDDQPRTLGLSSGIFAGGLKGIWPWVLAHKVGVGIAVAFLIIGVGGFLMATYYLPQATVTLYTQKRTIDRDLQVTASPNATAVDKDEMVVPAEILTAEASQTKTFEATGEEEVGEKATGSVTITNKSSDSKSLPAGTVLASGSKQFVTTSAATVPAYEIDDDGISFGKSNVGVQAAAIGSEYNLDAGSEFTVGGYEESTMDAKNAADFSGGSKETVIVVTESDREEALTSLAQEVQDMAVESMKKKLTTDQLLLDEAVESTTDSTEYSHEVGAETTEFSLAITATATAPVVVKADLESLLTEAIEAKVPDGYELADTAPEIENHVLNVEDDGTLYLTSTFKAQVIPVVDTAELIADIKGKNPSAVEAYLKDQPNLNGYDISLSPKLPGPFYRLPSLESHIKVNVEVK